MEEHIESMLDEAISHFGISDIITIMLSQRLDRVIVEKQIKNCTKEKAINSLANKEYGKYLSHNHRSYRRFEK